jgi:ribosome-binding factor A
MRARHLLLAGLAAGLVGCGGAGTAGGDFDGVESDVAEAVERLQTAGARQESAGELCRAVLTSALARRLAADASSCEREIRHAIADADLSQFSVTDVSVRGDSATARVESAAGETRRVATVELVRERGDWRVAAIRSAG